MEKPYFLHIAPCGSKVPFVLSEPNQVPVVQVSKNQYTLYRKYRQHFKNRIPALINMNKIKAKKKKKKINKKPCKIKIKYFSVQGNVL